LSLVLYRTLSGAGKDKMGLNLMHWPISMT